MYKCAMWLIGYSINLLVPIDINTKSGIQTMNLERQSEIRWSLLNHIHHEQHQVMIHCFWASPTSVCACIFFYVIIFHFMISAKVLYVCKEYFPFWCVYQPFWFWSGFEIRWIDITAISVPWIRKGHKDNRTCFNARTLFHILSTKYHFGLQSK